MKSLVIFVILFRVSHQWDLVKQTKGAVWPLPQIQETQLEFFTLDSSSFEFIYNGTQCQILNDSFVRYQTLIFEPPRFRRHLKVKSKIDIKKWEKNYKDYLGELNGLEIVLDGQCETWPYHDMDEKYELKINITGVAKLISSSVWGVLRGLETFSHLTYRDDGNNIIVNATSIIDYPRFSYRGVMLDTSRHYLSKSIILKNLDAMTYSKYNVFHWHIVDDQSFPYQSKNFPSLSEKGAFVPETHIYSIKDIVEVIEYARIRGIRVIVEFDTPGHTASWGLGMSQLLTQCYKKNNGSLEPDGCGPFDPSVNTTYEFLQNFFTEVNRLFPDEYIHLGGDEVDFDCWKSNSEIQDFMEAQGYGSDYELLQNYYTENLMNIIASQKKIIVWQDVFDNNVELAPDTIVQVWRDESMSELQNVTGSGYQALLSSCWYLNYFEMANDWITFYPCEPLAFNGTDEQKELVIGGEACIWGEYVDGTNLITRLWPRALAPAERLWSNKTVNNHTIATPRFEEQRCRMVERGINAEPVNGPSFCPSDYLI